MGLYLEAARSSQQRSRRLFLEHNLLGQMSPAVAKGLQLIGQGTGLAQATDDTLDGVWFLFDTAHIWIPKAQRHYAQETAASLDVTTGG